MDVIIQIGPWFERLADQERGCKEVFVYGNEEIEFEGTIEIIQIERFRGRSRQVSLHRHMPTGRERRAVERELG